jgi:hypothetical protein
MKEYPGNGLGTQRWDFEKHCPAEQKDVGRKESGAQSFLFEFNENAVRWDEDTGYQKLCSKYYENHIEENGVCILCGAKIKGV